MSASEKLSALEKVRSLRDQANKLESEARAEALEKAHKAVDDLNELGVKYRLVEGDEPQKPARKAGQIRKKSDGPCPICNFKTDPPHDGRRHRNQGEHKKPFSAAELKEFGMTKVD